MILNEIIYHFAIENQKPKIKMVLVHILQNFITVLIT